MSNITQYLVLSHGRSGSVLLAQKLGKAVNALPHYVKTFEDLINTPIQHSHLILTKLQTLNFQRVFNLRTDPVETILSNILADHYRQFHKFSSQVISTEPFEFTNWKFIDDICNQYQLWHYQTGKDLNSQDAVVFYEDMITRLKNVNDVYVPIYPDKRSLIINYDQVVDCIGQYRKGLLDSQQAFVDHDNLTDIFNIINR